MHTNKKSISARIELSPYANKILAVLKAKYGLKDKSEAINRFADLYGDEITEKETNDEYIKKIIEITDNHLSKHKGKEMGLEELDRLCEV